MALTLCSAPNPLMDMLDPVVYDARSRLAWSMLYVFVGPIPALLSLSKTYQSACKAHNDIQS